VELNLSKDQRVKRSPSIPVNSLWGDFGGPAPARRKDGSLGWVKADGGIGNAYARMGQEAEAREMISELQKHAQTQVSEDTKSRWSMPGWGKRMKLSRGWRNPSPRATRDSLISK